MYERHFGFSRPLFADTTVQGDAVFLTTATKALMRDLAVALARKNSVAILSGESGSGKTTIALNALQEISTRLAITCISHRPESEDELLEQFLTDFGCETAAASRVERLQLWRQFLTEMAATDTRVCLLVENADRITEDVLLSLHTLTAPDASLIPGANIVMTSTRPAETLLRSPELTALRQRVRLCRPILPLSPNETRQYLEFKCRSAGVNPDELLAEDAAPILFELSGGLMRVTDNLLESALSAAAANGEHRITGARIESVADSYYGLSPLASPAVLDLLEEAPASECGNALWVAGADGIPILTECLAAAPTRSRLGAAGSRAIA